MGGILSDPNSSCTCRYFDRLQKARALPDQVFPCALNDDRAHTDKGNMYQDMHEYLSMTFQNGVLRMAMARMGYFRA